MELMWFLKEFMTGTHTAAQRNVSLNIEIVSIVAEYPSVLCYCLRLF